MKIYDIYISDYTGVKVYILLKHIYITKEGIKKLKDYFDELDFEE